MDTADEEQRATEATEPVPGEQDDESSDFINNLFLSNLTPHVLPKPLPPERCPLFCCFYAEFDNIVGPQIVHQSPPSFMDQPMGMSFGDIHALLEKTFAATATCDSGEEHQTTRQTDAEESIFDSTCDYIITGNELASQIVCLSTHNFHILTQPTNIHNERYDRNSLFFSVGFVLRRSEDPQPFRSILSKFADTLYRMEVESFFLSKSKHALQPILRNLLSSLNAGECNVLLNESNALHLKLFRATKTSASTRVADHVVPVLLRRDAQIQKFDWDLAISWVVGQLDGVAHAKSLSVKSEVDDEIMRACLQVLQHHSVVALVDMFFYSNVYESTGKQFDSNCLEQDLLDFSLKRKPMDDASERSSVMSIPRGKADTPALKNGIVELYYCFDRTKTVAEMFTQKLEESSFWRNILQELDHRRFITFGVIYGFIRRIHNHPLARVEVKPSLLRNDLKKKLPHLVAEQMNGQTCDDALVCRFEKPIEELIRLAKSIGTVIDLYA